MVSRQEKIRAGAFVVLTLSLLVSSLIGLKYYSSLEEYREYYFLYDHTIFGLEKGSKVAFNGVPIGVVSDIGFSPEDRSKVKILLKITAPEEELTLLDDTKVSIKYVSYITGTLYVELSGGKGKVVHDPAKPIPVNVTILDNLEQRLGRLDTTVNEILNQMKDLLNKQNRAKVAKLLDDVSMASSHLKDVTESARSALRSFDTSMKTVEATVTENRENVKKLTKETGEVAAHLKVVLAKVKEEKTIEEATATIRQFRQTASKVGQSTDKLVATADSLGTAGKKTLVQLEKTLAELDLEVKKTLTQFRSTAKTGEVKLTALTEETTKTLTQARSTLKSGETHLATLAKDAQGALKQATTLLKNGEAKLDEVAKVIKTTGTAATELAEKSKTVIDRTNKILENTNKIVAGASDDIEKTLSGIRKASENINKLAESLSSVVVSKTPTVARLLDNLKAASGDLRDFAEQIRQQPSSLIGRQPKDERSFRK
ncbi:MAG: MlaD family protein [Planctomycetota bacterium]|nr:MlaD family protein [Planctomycetota bacterium]